MRRTPNETEDLGDGRAIGVTRTESDDPQSLDATNHLSLLRCSIEEGNLQELFQELQHINILFGSHGTTFDIPENLVPDFITLLWSFLMEGVPHEAKYQNIVSLLVGAIIGIIRRSTTSVEIIMGMEPLEPLISLCAFGAHENMLCTYALLRLLIPNFPPECCHVIFEFLLSLLEQPNESLYLVEAKKSLTAEVISSIQVTAKYLSCESITHFVPTIMNIINAFKTPNYAYIHYFARPLATMLLRVAKQGVDLFSMYTDLYEFMKWCIDRKQIMERRVYQPEYMEVIMLQFMNYPTPGLIADFPIEYIIAILDLKIQILRRDCTGDDVEDKPLMKEIICCLKILEVYIENQPLEWARNLMASPPCRDTIAMTAKYGSFEISQQASMFVWTFMKHCTLDHTLEYIDNEDIFSVLADSFHVYDVETMCQTVGPAMFRTLDLLKDTPAYTPQYGRASELLQNLAMCVFDMDEERVTPEFVEELKNKIEHL